MKEEQEWEEAAYELQGIFQQEVERGSFSQTENTGFKERKEKEARVGREME